MQRQRILLLTLILAGAALSACGGGYYVRVAPPVPRYGVVGYAPGPGYVWTDGYWDWRGGNWAWVGGSWRRPPRRGAAWAPAHWDRHGRGYRFVPGHWRH